MLRSFTIGALLGGGIVGAYVWSQKDAWARRGARLAASLEAEGREMQTYMEVKGRGVERELTQLAIAEAERVSRATAEQYMGTTYGLTPERIRRIGILAQAFE